MTQKDKELLLQDLCARLPYKPFAQWHCEVLNKFRDVKIMKISTYGKNIDDYHINVLCQPEPGVDYEASIVEIKPYLRPMSSMTEEEQEEYQKFLFPCPDYDGRVVVGVYHKDLYKVYDWLNAHHFDYRGLIEKGLAIVVNENNNPYK